MKSMMRVNFFFAFLVLIALAIVSPARTPAKIQVSVKKITKNISLIDGLGCNITVADGPDGLLIIDTGYKTNKLDSVLSTISGHPAKYILNTNFHFDHIGDNSALCDKGAIIISQLFTRDVIASGWKAPEFAGMKFPAILPAQAKYLPKICFNDSLVLYFNDDNIQAIHFPRAHSGGDAIYYFKNQNVMHVGDLFVSYGFPYIDFTYGGTIAGLLAAVDNILKLCDDKTILITGHGAISDRKGLLAYREMLAESKGQIAKLIREGKNLKEIIEYKSYRNLFKGSKSKTEIGFITIVYNELTKK